MKIGVKGQESGEMNVHRRWRRIRYEGLTWIKQSECVSLADVTLVKACGGEALRSGRVHFSDRTILQVARSEMVFSLPVRDRIPSPKVILGSYT